MPATKPEGSPSTLGIVGGGSIVPSWARFIVSEYSEHSVFQKTQYTQQVSISGRSERSVNQIVGRTDCLTYRLSESSDSPSFLSVLVHMATFALKMYWTTRTITKARIVTANPIIA